MEGRGLRAGILPGGLPFVAAGPGFSSLDSRVNSKRTPVNGCRPLRPHEWLHPQGLARVLKPLEQLRASQASGTSPTCLCSGLGGNVSFGPEWLLLGALTTRLSCFLSGSLIPSIASWFVPSTQGFHTPSALPLPRWLRGPAPDLTCRKSCQPPNYVWTCLEDSHLNGASATDLWFHSISAAPVSAPRIIAQFWDENWKCLDLCLPLGLLKMDFPNSPAPCGLAWPVDALEASGQPRGPPGWQPLPGPLPHSRTQCLLCPPRGEDGVKAERAQRLLVWKVSEKPKDKEGQRPSGAQEGQETVHAEGGTQEAPRKEPGLEIQKAWRARWVSRSQPEPPVVLSLATGSLRIGGRKWISLYLLCWAQAGRGLQRGPTAAAQGCSYAWAEPGPGWGSWDPQT